MAEVPKWSASERLVRTDIANIIHSDLAVEEKLHKVARACDYWVKENVWLRQGLATRSQVSSNDDTSTTFKTENVDDDHQMSNILENPEPTTNSVNTSSILQGGQLARFYLLRITKSRIDGAADVQTLFPTDEACENFRKSLDDVDSELTELMKGRQSRTTSPMGTWDTYCKKPSRCIRQYLRGHPLFAATDNSVTSTCRVCFNNNLPCVHYSEEEDAFVIVPLPKQIVAVKTWDSFERCVYGGHETQRVMEMEHRKVRY